MGEQDGDEVPVARSPEREAEGRAMVDTGDVQREARVSFAADLDHDGGRLDAVAGCEFVDDRIRLPD